MHSKPDYSLLFEAIRRERNQFVMLALLLILGGIFCCMQMGSVNLSLTILLIIIGLTMILLGFKVLYDALKYWDEANHELMKTIVDTPKDIVWIYSTLTQVSPFGVNLFSRGTMFFKLVDGNAITLSASTKQLSKISASLNTVLPHATFGYSQEREQWYIASPILLLRND